MLKSCLWHKSFWYSHVCRQMHWLRKGNTCSPDSHIDSNNQMSVFLWWETKREKKPTDTVLRLPLHIKHSTMRYVCELHRSKLSCWATDVFTQTLTDVTSSDNQTDPAADIVVLLQRKQREGIQRWQRGLELLLWVSEGTITRRAALNISNGPRTIWTRASTNARTGSVV